MLVDRVRYFSPSLVALLTQVAATLIILLLVYPVLASFGVEMPLVSYAFIQGVIAAFLGSSLGLASWWQPINLFFTPALVVSLSLGIAPVWFLAAFILMFLLYWSVFKSQIPLYLSSRKAWVAVAELLPKKSGVRFLDLGAGLGGMLNYLGAQYPDGHFSGMEIAPLPFLLGWVRKQIINGNYSLAWGDLWQQNLADQDVVYAYLSPVPMAKLWHKISEEMPAGSYFISNTFAVPGVEPESIVELDDFHYSRLYIYRIPARKE